MDSAGKSKWLRYTKMFKLQVMHFAEENGYKEVESHHGVREKSVKTMSRKYDTMIAHYNHKV